MVRESIPHSEMRKENVMDAWKELGVIYAFYGPRGSEIIRTEEGLLLYPRGVDFRAYTTHMSTPPYS